jgi:hypothetical protein
VWDTGAANEELLFHLHHANEYGLQNSGGMNNILLLRNYKECVYSHLITSGHSDGFAAMDGIPQLHLKHYQELIKLYKSLYDPTKSLVIYYEDFVESPDRALLRLIDYIDSVAPDLAGPLPQKDDMVRNLEDLIDNLSEHRERCLGGYRGEIPGTVHSGQALSSSPTSNDLQYYSKRSALSDLKRVDLFMYNNMDKNIYDKYLSGYREGE